MAKIDDPNDYEALQATWEGATDEIMDHHAPWDEDGRPASRPAPRSPGDPAAFSLRYAALCHQCRVMIAVGAPAIGRKRQGAPGWRVFHPMCHDRFVASEIESALHLRSNSS